MFIDVSWLINIIFLYKQQMNRQVKSVNFKKNSEPTIIINKICPTEMIKPQSPHKLSKVKSRFEEIKSARNPRTRKLSNELSYREPTQSLKSSTSKFSQRIKSIVNSRTNIFNGDSILNNDEQQKKKIEKNMVTARYGQDAHNENMFSGLLAVNNLQTANQQLRKSGRRFKQRQQITDSNNNVRIQQGVQYVELPKLDESQLMFKQKQNCDPMDKGQLIDSKQQKYKQLTGYWKRQNKFVSLTILEKNQKLNFEHYNILPIYAQITIKNIRYVISDQYKNFSLKHLIDEFGPFDENMSKRYLKQIVLGLQHMHYHRCGHNRLTTRSILYNKNGNIFINAMNATSLFLSAKQLTSNQELHYFAPQFLQPKAFSSNSLKNDIWALGCIALEMFHLNINTSKLHPYNCTSFNDEDQEKMIDNLKQICRKYFTQNEDVKIKQGAKEPMVKLSQTATNFIKRCLQIVADRRSTIDQLLEHQLFQGV